MKRWDQKSFSIFAHFKRDGINIRVMPNGEVLTRKPQNWYDKLSWHPQIKAMLRISKALGYEFHCEVWKRFTKASSVITAINDEDPKLMVECYMIPQLGDAWLWDVASECFDHGIDFVPYLIHYESMRSMDQTWQQWKEYPGCRGCYLTLDLESEPFKIQHIEGFVLKNHNADDMQKIKRHTFIDLIVTGLKPGKNKHQGKIGALICSSIEGHVICNVGGLTDFDRKRDDWIGKVVEVKYDYAGDGGKLRFPSLSRERPDKPASECTIDQDDELREYHDSEKRQK